MNTCITTIISPPAGAAAPLRALAAALATWAQRFDAWRTKRAQASRDRETLAQMSERELHDIGLGHGYLYYVADSAWTRDKSH